MAPVFIAGNDPVAVRLLFHPSVAGKIVTITAAPRVTFDPSQAVLRVQSTGECLVSLQLDQDVPQGHVTFSCEGLKTTVPFFRVRPERVVTKEKEDNGGG